MSPSVECSSCGRQQTRSGRRARCEECGAYLPEPPVYAFSRTTETWYLVDDYESAGDGRIVAKSKQAVDREDVPQEWLDAVDEGGET